MTLVSIDRRLRKVEARDGRHGDVQRMSDDQLRRCIRQGYHQLERKHGSLSAAVDHLRATGNHDDMALAVLIAEDIGGADASKH